MSIMFLEKKDISCTLKGWVVVKKIAIVGSIVLSKAIKFKKERVPTKRSVFLREIFEKNKRY